MSGSKVFRKNAESIDLVNSVIFLKDRCRLKYFSTNDFQNDNAGCFKLSNRLTIIFLFFWCIDILKYLYRY